MPPIDDFLGYLFKIFVGAFLGLLAWLFKSEKKKLDDQAKEIADLKSHSVTEEKVREIVTESINNAVSPMDSNLQDIKRLLEANITCIQDINQRLARQEGYQEAVKELKASSAGT